MHTTGPRVREASLEVAVSSHWILEAASIDIDLMKGMKGMKGVKGMKGMKGMNRGH